MPESDDSLPRLLGGRYRLEAKLGSGGMGIVYRASDLTMKRSVAVKLIRGVDGVELDEEVAGRFLREAKNTARIQHENIIEVFDLGRDGTGDMFFVMELLEGESLSAKLRRETKLAPETAIHILRQMCAALHVAHAAGIIHRDLKPANVMLVERAGDRNYVKVLDFGVAKSYAPDQQTQLTHTGMLVGTVEYMAPEQIMGRKVDGRTDIYALGCVMYRMFTGKAPFRDGGVPAMIHAHLNVVPKSVVELAPGLPAEIDRVVQRCLAKRPEQRYASMEELSTALAGALPGPPLANLEYNPDDPYDASDKTEVAKPPVPASRAQAGDELLDDATIRIDRSATPPSKPRESPAAPQPMARRLPPGIDEIQGAAPGIVDTGDSGATAVMNRPGVSAMLREDVSTAKRPIPDDITRIDRAEPRECAMCRTMNPPHVRACVACGVSLAAEDQDAVRARVAAPSRPAPPRTAHLPAPQMPPPNTGGYPPLQSQPVFAPPYQPPRQSHAGIHGAQGMWNVPPPPPPPPSMWERFLTWTGLRGR
ncbi:MAG: protein kinase [Labilithrix sp.]|nr:protein kinase [Labilithrix sp.]